ncbi:YdcH family protein [Tropicimonas isoalkanivorans]|uniref:DUF465 domain-containing protein n=1 Tax=Tropicimonas isoalkanivorans TaxID=441112 RepID=A0A1I1GN34_9RHOB|nr:YdcH family protein [Tropicimonas isoalkanivorans]SFC10713.1 hypothetical protein SAMN04488094_102565 [Tropicimonas isoalkanivorans]
MKYRDIPKSMSQAARIESVQRRHRQLDLQIAEEQSCAFVDSTRIAQLKREKLRLKDELARRQGVLRTLSRLSAAS